MMSDDEKREFFKQLREKNSTNFVCHIYLKNHVLCMRMKMMNTFNTFILDITVSIIDFLYRGRDYQRFWVLEEIALFPLTLPS